MDEYFAKFDAENYNSLADEDPAICRTWESTPEKYPGRNSIVFKTFKSTNGRRESNSIFSVTQLFEYVSLTISAVMIMLIFGNWNWAVPDGKRACDAKLDHIPSICKLTSLLQDGAVQYRVLAAFILGGFVVSSVSTWQSRRLAYGMLCNSTRNLIINISSNVPADEMYDKCTLIRWAILAYELCVLKARNTSDTKEAYEYLQALNLLEEDEWDILIDGGNKNNTVFWWINTKASMLQSNNCISDIRYQILSNTVTRCRERGNDLMSRNDKDQPRPYVFICAMLVNLNLLLTSISKGFEWAIMLHDSGAKIFERPIIYVDIFILFTYNAIFAMLFDLCSALYNPFGPRPIDIPHVKTSQSIRRLAKEISIGELPISMHKSNDLRSSGFMECDDTGRLAELESKLSKANAVLGRSMLFRPGKDIILEGDDSMDVFDEDDLSVTPNE
eukprot:982257_1